MDWKQYEVEIFNTFKKAYPNARISYNQSIKGRYSKTNRQIDVLIEGQLAGRRLRLIIDGKYLKKRVDVKHVESFISMVEDVEAVQGIMITSKGYTPAAINRAYHGPTDVELDILNFDELKQFQGVGGFPYHGEHGVILSAPFGWVLDGTRREGFVAALYQRGKTYDDARKSGEFMYINFFTYDEKVRSLKELFKLQEYATLDYHPDAKFDYWDSVEREDGNKTQIRKILRPEVEVHEYTGFVDFDDYCAFCVLFTPEELSRKNIRKLEYCLERMLPIKVDQVSIVHSRINSFKSLMINTSSLEEKAKLLISIAENYRVLNDAESAKNAYMESKKLFPENYGAQLGLLEIGFETIERDQLIERFYSLAPGNRKICDELVRLGIEFDQLIVIEDFLIEKTKDIQNNSEGLGNVYFSLGDLFYTQKTKEKALNYFILAKQNFEKCFEENHPALESINEAIKRLNGLS